MAQIIFLDNPLEREKKIETEANTLREAFDKLNANGSVLVQVNGTLLERENTDLDKKFKEKDIVKIYRPLEGGSNDRKIIGRLIQVVGLIVSAYTGGAGGTIIALGASLIGGLVIASGVKPAKVADQRDEGEAAAQVFSVTSAQNEVRKLEPVNLVLGSHRLAPDFGSQPIKEYYNQEGLTFEDLPVVAVDGFPIDVSNVNSWPTLPAGWLKENYFQTDYFNFYDPNNNTEWPTSLKTTGNFWPYSISYHPDVSLTQIRNDVILDRDISEVGFARFFPNHFTTSRPITIEGTKGQLPIPIYHSDPSDPFYGTYSTLQLLLWSVYGEYNDIDINSDMAILNWYDPGGVGHYYSLSSVNSPTYVTNNYEKIYGFLIGDPNTIANEFGGSTSIDDANTQEGVSTYTKLFYSDPNFYYIKTDYFESHVYNINGTYKEGFGGERFFPNGVEQRKQAVWSFIQALNSPSANQVILTGKIRKIEMLPLEPRDERARHIFHYGLGDLTIEDLRVGDTPLDKFIGNESVDKTKGPLAWPLPDRYPTNAKVIKGAPLINNDSDFSGPEGVVGLSDSSDYNWVKRETPEECKEININVSGRSFESKDDGSFSYYPAKFEVHYGPVSNASYTSVDYFEIGSYRADPARRTIKINLPIAGKYKLRIRKQTKDPTNSKFIQEFNCDSFNFILEDTSPYLAENRIGVTLSSRSQAGASTSKFNLLAESKCFVNQSWEKTRNPAWWFLYYARGGFINKTADGSLSYPYSPTVGWVNSAEHPDNEERLFGAGLKEEDIDLEKIEEWARFCDEKNLRCDFVIRSASSVHEILQRIAGAGRASVSYYSSKLSVIYEDPEEPITGMFGMSNILKGSFQVTYAVEDLPYKIKGKFTDRDNEWKTEEVEAIVPNSLPDNLNVEEVVLDGITERSRAQREINILAARQYYQRRSYSWKTAAEGLTVMRGDKVYLSHDVTCYNQSGRVVDAEIESGLAKVLKTNVCLEETTDVMVRFLDGSIVSYKAEARGKDLILEEGVPSNLIPEHLAEGKENLTSDFKGTNIDSLIFFSGPMETLGKAVRVVSVEPSDGLKTFTITAIEEDPIVWSFEYDNTIDIEPDAKERVVARVYNAHYESLGGNRYRISWESSGTHGAYINQVSGGGVQTLTSEGQYSQFNNQAVLTLEEGGFYDLEIEPLVIGQASEKEKARITIRT